MIRQLAIATIAALGLISSPVLAAGGKSHVEDFAFSFEGPFGTFDQHQLQRGLQVYTEVCAGCHGLQYVAFRTLGDKGGLGYSEEAVKAYAKNFEVFDPELDDTRTAVPADKFPAVTGAGAPDLSLMTKARAGFTGPNGLLINPLIKGQGGAEYVASILTGYTGKEKEEAGATLYENTAFPGGWISMAPPLSDDQVEFADGHDADVHHMAQDVAAFLTWTAEPKMMVRKKVGILSVAFLALLSVLLYLTNKAIWAPIKHRRA